MSTTECCDKDRASSTGLPVCPLSMAVFLGSALWVTLLKRQQRRDELPCCQVVFVLGGPGAGKGTQCELLTQRLDGWAHLSAGDLLRAERKKGGPLGDLINQKIASGQLVPSEVTCQLLENAMRETYEADGTRKFLIDGYPRSQGNVDAWNQTMARHKLEFVLYLECPEEVMTGRLLERGQSSGRLDDNLQVIRKRFATFQQESKPIVDLYGDQVHKIYADKPVEGVYQQVAALFVNL